MKHSSIPAAQTVVQYCKAKGIDNIVISPGSRNAPLIIGFSEDPFFSCFSIVDERCAAFFALGIAQQIGRPVAVVCTSGSALLNYYPAIAEGYYSRIPIIVLSADRPSYKIDVGDGQTIRQEGVFERHIGYSGSLRQDVVHATDRIRKYRPEWLENGSPENIQEGIQDHNNGELDRVLEIALKSKLPVHVNIPLEEPLYGKRDVTSIGPIKEATHTKGNPAMENLEGFADLWNSSDRKMVIVGVNGPNTVEQEFLDKLADDPSTIVFTETTSNLHHSNFFPSIDSIVAPIEKLDRPDEQFKKLEPELLLTFGGMIISKKIKAFLRQYRPAQHWHIDPYNAFDTFFSLSQHFKIGANDFFKKFLPLVHRGTSDYYPYWSAIRTAYEAKRKLYLEQVPFTDMWAFHRILGAIPPKSQLQLANSSTVRYAQLFDLDPSLKVFCNRGTSGIDGSTSTAIGAALHHKTPTVLITGDLSFFYDNNALWNQYIRPDFRIVLINNQGGGIFRILPGCEDGDNFETYFETTHKFNAGPLCEMYGFDHETVQNETALKTVLPNFFKRSERPKLIEIRTPRLMNDKILLTYFDFISSVFINH